MSRRSCVITLIVALVVIVVLVSIPVWLLQRNPPVVQEPPWDSPQTRALAVRACYDCHSNQTVWPWYDRIPPASWLAMFDTIRGRRHLNFSTWGVPQTGFLGGEGEGGGGEGRGGVAHVIQDGSMPPSSYLLLHPDARLTDAEKQQLIQGLQASLK
jgi:hypothetical protein